MREIEKSWGDKPAGGTKHSACRSCRSIRYQTAKIVLLVCLHVGVILRYGKETRIPLKTKTLRLALRKSVTDNAPRRDLNQRPLLIAQVSYNYATERSLPKSYR